MKKFILCSALILCYGTSAFAKSTPTMDISNGLSLMAEATHMASDNSHYKMDIESPLLSGNALNSAAQLYNQSINKIINTTITDFKTKIVENSAYVKNLPQSVQENTLFIDYSATVFKAGNQQIISLRINNEFYYAGSAHPSHQIQVFNYDLSSGKELAMSDLFKPKSSYLDKISDYARRDLLTKIKNEDKNEFDKGTAPIADNYLNWNLKPNGILITFNEYQVAAYVFGQPEVLVPYTMLEDDIAPNAPIAFCIKTPSECASN
ncbi:MAG: RsiV family protein [Gammaproteobacteria bacterium]|nr:RsiV family protein [Gammaproteobacteria bacterium]